VVLSRAVAATCLRYATPAVCHSRISPAILSCNFHTLRMCLYFASMAKITDFVCVYARAVRGVAVYFFSYMISRTVNAWSPSLQADHSFHCHMARTTAAPRVFHFC
jgi:hypothetical protein